MWTTQEVTKGTFLWQCSLYTNQTWQRWHASAMCWKVLMSGPKCAGLSQSHPSGVPAGGPAWGPAWQKHCTGQPSAQPTGLPNCLGWYWWLCIFLTTSTWGEYCQRGQESVVKARGDEEEGLFKSCRGHPSSTVSWHRHGAWGETSPASLRS